MITFDELVKEHEQLWSDTTLDQQQAKFDEELQEFKKALGGTEDELFELADMVIVSAGVARFDYFFGLDLLHETMTYLDKTEWSTEALLEAVEKKMEKNRSRTWQKVDGVGYHHIGEKQ